MGRNHPSLALRACIEAVSSTIGCDFISPASPWVCCPIPFGNMALETQEISFGDLRSLRKLFFIGNISGTG